MPASLAVAEEVRLVVITEDLPNQVVKVLMASSSPATRAHPLEPAERTPARLVHPRGDLVILADAAAAEGLL
jgi:hypothetical protein